MRAIWSGTTDLADQLQASGFEVSIPARSDEISLDVLEWNDKSANTFKLHTDGEQFHFWANSYSFLDFAYDDGTRDEVMAWIVAASLEVQEGRDRVSESRSGRRLHIEANGWTMSSQPRP